MTIPGRNKDRRRVMMTPWLVLGIVLAALMSISMSSRFLLLYMVLQLSQKIFQNFVSRCFSPKGTAVMRLATLNVSCFRPCPPSHTLHHYTLGWFCTFECNPPMISKNLRRKTRGFGHVPLQKVVLGFHVVLCRGVGQWCQCAGPRQVVFGCV